jgi:hypothetical protein
MYKLFKDKWANEICSVLKTNEDGTHLSIPFAPDNTDYQTYLKWVAEGNIPTPADE